MSIARRSHSSNRPVLFEALEARKLLTTISGSGVFEYKDTDDQLVRVVYQNVTAELIFAGSGAATLGDHVPVTAPDDTPGRDLFKVYVTQSDMDSFISVALVPALSAKERPMDPYGAGLDKGIAAFVREGGFVEGDDGSGSVILGARTGDADSKEGERAVVITGFAGSSIGLHPAGTITAGLEVVNGQSLGRFLFGGVVTGVVNVAGNMDTFYAGWLLTGDASGGFVGGGSAANPNFIVGGDIRNILSWDSIGTDSAAELSKLDYSSNFVADIGGYLGQIRSLTDSVNGQVHVHHGTTNPSLDTPYREIEYRVPNISNFTGFQIGEFNDETFFNDTYDTAQFLGSYGSAQAVVPIVAVDGNLDVLNGDSEDWYALGVMGGQKVSVMCSGAFVVVYDKDLRPVASNLANPAAPFQFTAETPGVYRFQVTPMLPFGGTYQLVASAGDIALGGVIAKTEIYDDASSATFSADRGDIGAVVAGTTFSAAVSNTVAAFNGDIRAIEADTIGESSLLAGPSVFTSGSVGLIHSVSGDLFMNAYAAVGRDYQLIDSAGDVAGTFLANRAIGTLHGGTVGTGGPLTIAVNADGIGADGVIDLISADGDMGGPTITTGPGGNVRYIHVGGDVVNDPFFGGSVPIETTYDPGQAVTLTDDSGALITIAPYSQINPLYDPTDPTSTLNIGGSVTILALPIRGSGGVALVRVTVDGVPVSLTPELPTSPARPLPALVTISTAGLAPNATAEIGELVVAGGGDGFIIDPRFPIFPGREPRYMLDPNGIRVLLSGPNRVDLLDFNGTGSFSSIINNSGGEIVTVRAASVGELGSATTLGLARNSTGAAIQPPVIGTDVFPFSDQRIGVILSGDLLTARAGQGVGNFNVSGTIHNLAANYDRVNVDGVFEGINGPIYAGGDIKAVNIGEGVLGSGTRVPMGNAPRPEALSSAAGIYAQGWIGSVIGGIGADIRGSIASVGTPTELPEPPTDPDDPEQPTRPTLPAPVRATGIGSITLNGGSIVDAFIGVVDDLTMSTRMFAYTTTSTGEDTISSPIYSVGPINVNGVGGIIGATITGGSLQSVTVNGFGILNSSLFVGGNGTIGPINAAGYGIRGTFINAGAVLRGLTARGTGANLPTYAWSPSVRLSETGLIDPVFGVAIDPYSGSALGARNDLHAALGTSASAPVIDGVTDSGVLEDVTAYGSRDLWNVSASRIRSRTEPGSPDNPIANPGVAPQTYAMSLNFANSIRSIRATGLINGLQVTTGRLNQFIPGTDVFRLGMTVAGPIQNVIVRGTLGGNSFINAVGANGRIGAITVAGDLVGDLFASNSIARINIGRNLTGNVTVVGSTRGLALGALRLGGVLVDGSLNVIGNVGNIVSAYSLGQIGDQLTVTGSVNQIFVGSARLAGTVLNSNIVVGGNVGVLRVNGRVDGTVNVGGTLRNLQVTADAGSGPNLLTAPVTAGLNINNVRIVGGNVASNVTAGFNVGVFQILNGNLLSGSTLQSQFGNINLVRIANGSLLGSVLAPNGRIGQIVVDGNIGDGVNPLNITAATLGTLNTRGSILAGVTAAVAGPLTNLMVSGNVEAGAVVSGAPIVRQNIRGVINGSVVG